MVLYHHLTYYLTETSRISENRSSPTLSSETIENEDSKVSEFRVEDDWWDETNDVDAWHTGCSKETDHLDYFDDNFGKYGPILTIFSLLQQEIYDTFFGTPGTWVSEWRRIVVCRQIVHVQPHGSLWVSVLLVLLCNDAEGSSPRTLTSTWCGKIK